MNTSAFLAETQDSAEELLSSANTGMGESAWITPISFKTGIHKHFVWTITLKATKQMSLSISPWPL